MANAKPQPNLIRFGFGKDNGFIGADLDSVFLGGEERYGEEETREIKVTEENRAEVVAVLRNLADFIEGNPSS